MKSYKPRIIDSLIERKLKGKGAILIEGAKWCGKTTSAEQFATSVLYIDDPSNIKQNIETSEINPSLLLRGKTPRLIDEWQLTPKIWDAIRYEIDHRSEQGQFILTGSAVPADASEIIHSGTGRFGWIHMRPMSLYESGDSSGEVSLRRLFEGEKSISGTNEVDVEKLAFLVCRGGWPLSSELKDDVALDQAFDYIEAVVKSDINRADGVKKDPQRVRALLRSYARMQGSQASATKILEDVRTNDVDTLSTQTISSYIEALKKIFVVEEMSAWNPNLRSKVAVRTSDTRYFVDPSIAAASLRIGPGDLVNDLETFGLLFETLVVRDIRIYAESIDGDVYHYRDKSDTECDVVIHLRNGKYALVEVKIGGDSQISHAAESLNKVLSKIDTSKMGEPTFMAIITGVGNYAYMRNDGIFVIPIGCLKN